MSGLLLESVVALAAERISSGEVQAAGALDVGLFCPEGVAWQ